VYSTILLFIKLIHKPNNIIHKPYNLIGYRLKDLNTFKELKCICMSMDLNE